MEIIAGAVFIAVVVVIWRLQQRAGARRRHLATQGKPVIAIVSRRFTRSKPKAGKRHYLAYRFETADGQQIDTTTLVSAQDYQDHANGDEVRVVYNPQRPEESQLESYLRRKGLLASKG